MTRRRSTLDVVASYVPATPSPDGTTGRIVESRQVFEVRAMRERGLVRQLCGRITDRRSPAAGRAIRAATVGVRPMHRASGRPAWRCSPC